MTILTVAYMPAYLSTELINFLKETMTPSMVSEDGENQQFGIVEAMDHIEGLEMFKKDYKELNSLDLQSIDYIEI